MKEAGLTAGGFYAHFDSKDALFALALDDAFETSMAGYFRGLEKLDDAQAIDLLTRRYLSRAHRDNIEEGCPLPQLAADVVRAGAAAQDVFESRLRELLLRLAAALAPHPGMTANERALALAALYVGGLTLARATAGRPLSDQILLACRKQARSTEEQPRPRRKRSRAA